MANITFTGLSSSTDLNSIIDALIDTKRRARIQPLENWKTDWETKLEDIDTIDSALSTFYTAVRGLDTISEFMVRSATSSDTDKLTVSADSTATPGAYSVQVGTNIKHRLGSDGKADRDTTAYAVAGDQIQITVGGSTEIITIDGGTYTLDGIASEITAESTLATAAVIDDGSNSNVFRLVLTANNGGASNTISIGTNDTSVDFAMSGAGDRIDIVENGTWTGSSSAASGGQYLGTTNKTFQFNVTSITGSGTVGTDNITIHWVDGKGNKGDVTFDSSYTAGTLVNVFQGVQVSLSAGDVNSGDNFSIDVWHPDLQAGQDEGIAKAEKEVHSGFADTSTTAVTSTAQTFSYTYNGQQTTINISADATLTDLVNAINNDAQNPGVTASILNDGTGLSTAYHLVLTGNKTGAAYKITSISHTLDNFDSTFNESQSAQNAMVKVDSYPPGNEYIQKSSNSITDVIGGLTLHLIDSGTTTVTVTTDKDAIIQKAEDFREAYNNLTTAIQEATFFDENAGESGSLLGNYAVQIIQSRLGNLLVGTAPGFQDPDETYTKLQQLGFSTDAQVGSETEGQLLLDASVLSAALDNDADAVADIFAANLDGISDDNQMSFESALIDMTEPGIYEVWIDTTVGDVKGYFRLQGEVAWREGILTGSSGDYHLTGATGDQDNPNPERGLEVHITYADGTGDHFATVRVKNGVVKEFSRELKNLLSTDGPLFTLEDNYNDIIDSIEDRIADEETRLKTYEKLLRQRFARLDALTTRMNQLSSFLTMFTPNLTKNSSGNSSAT